MCLFCFVLFILSTIYLYIFLFSLNIISNYVWFFFRISGLFSYRFVICGFGQICVPICMRDRVRLEASIYTRVHLKFICIYVHVHGTLAIYVCECVFGIQRCELSSHIHIKLLLLLLLSSHN